MPSYPVGDLAALGEAVRERRNFLGRSQDELRHHGGPGESVVSRIENVKKAAVAVSTGTLRGLDSCLIWEPGTASDIYLRGATAPVNIRLSGAVAGSAEAFDASVVAESESQAPSGGVSDVSDTVPNVATAGGRGEEWMPEERVELAEIAKVMAGVAKTLADTAARIERLASPPSASD